MTPAEQVRAYLARRPPEARRILKRIRQDVLAAAPGAVEVLSYQMPAFRFDGRILVWYAAWKEHVSLYPFNAATLRKRGINPKQYVLSKGTIRFPLTKPPSSTLVKRLVKARVAELRA